MSRTITAKILFAAVSGLLIFTTAIAESFADEEHKYNRTLSIAGQVRDHAGTPLANVVVSTGRTSVATDDAGIFILSTKRHAHKITLSFTKTGYLTTTESVHMHRHSDCTEHESDDDRESDDKRICSNSSVDFTVTKVMQPVGEAFQIDAAAGGTVTSQGVTLSFPPGVIDAHGQVDVTITVLDPAQADLSAMPGNSKRHSHHRRQHEVLSVVHIDLSQDGKSIKLSEESAIAAELPLSATSNLGIGESLPMHAYHSRALNWQRINDGVITASSTVQGKHAIKTNLYRVGWISTSEFTRNKSCVNGSVNFANGIPVSGAEIIATGTNYFGITKTHTGKDGTYCLKVRPDSAISIKANAILSGSLFSSTPILFETSVDSRRCHRGDCHTVPTLVIGDTACIKGTVQDQNGSMLAGIVINSSTGASSITDESGFYCMTIPANTDVNISAQDIPSVTVNVAASGSCNTGNCAQKDLVASPQSVPPPALETTCISGDLFHVFGFPLPNITLQAYDAINQGLLGDSAVTDTSGMFTLTGIPVFTDIMISGGDTTCTATGYYNSGGAGSPAEGSCLQVGGLICQ